MTASVFISYAREDKVFAKRLYGDLQEAGVKPWIDCVDLLPGQAWARAIRDAIAHSSYFVAVLSSRSVSKKGFVQKEIRQALDIAGEFPEDRIFIIPLRLDECEPSFEGLRRLHRADLFPSYEQGLKELLRVFTYDAAEKPELIEVLAQDVGVIKSIKDKGFGFVNSEMAGELFFHSNELRGITFDELRVGDLVRFSIAKGPKGFVATDIAINIERL
jgi:cold shock CspA family protein